VQQSQSNGPVYNEIQEAEEDQQTTSIPSAGEQPDVPKAWIAPED